MKRHSPKIVITGDGLQVNSLPDFLGRDCIYICLTMDHATISHEENFIFTLVRLHLIISMRNRCDSIEFCTIDMCRKCVFTFRLCEIPNNARDLNKKKEEFSFLFLGEIIPFASV